MKITDDMRDFDRRDRLDPERGRLRLKWHTVDMVMARVRRNGELLMPKAHWLELPLFEEKHHG
jgi:hypothetical protein